MISIVKFGNPPGMYRVGIVVGEYTRSDGQKIICVRTTKNVIAGQQFDPVPESAIKPATILELRENMFFELAEAGEAVNSFINTLDG